METISYSHKRRGGLIKGILAASFSRAAKSRPISKSPPYGSKVKPEAHSPDPTTNCSLNRSSFTGPSKGSWVEPVAYGQRGSCHYYYGVGDDNVDVKAASYISNVRERFKRFDNMDHANKCQEITH